MTPAVDGEWKEAVCGISALGRSECIDWVEKRMTLNTKPRQVSWSLKWLVYDLEVSASNLSGNPQGKLLKHTSNTPNTPQTHIKHTSNTHQTHPPQTHLKHTSNTPQTHLKHTSNKTLYGDLMGGLTQPRYENCIWHRAGKRPEAVHLVLRQSNSCG